MKRIFTFTLFLFLICQSMGALAAPQAELWSRWLVHREASSQTIDHQHWQQFLSRYIVTNKQDINLIRYTPVSTIN